MAEQHGSYYIPAYSIWPIVGAIGLLFLALGSLNFDSLWGSFVFFVGLITLLGMLFGWFSDVIRESHSGFYDVQMGRTFRWGMFWFLFCELFLFGTPLAALLYTRFSTLPSLAGMHSGGSLLTHYLLWPNFQASWPLTTNPNPGVFPAPKIILSVWGLPILSTLVLVVSAILTTFSFWSLKAGKTTLTLLSLIAAIILAVFFLVAQIRFLSFISQNGINFNSGIFGSLLFFLYSLHFLHVLVGLLMLVVVFWLTVKNYFGPHRTFGFMSAILFWDFLAVMWLFIFAGLFIG